MADLLKEVADLLLENLSKIKEIGSRLHMSQRTAKFHVSNHLAKCRVQHRADLILFSLSRSGGPGVSPAGI